MEGAKTLATSINFYQPSIRNDKEHLLPDNAATFLSDHPPETDLADISLYYKSVRPRRLKRFLDSVLAFTTTILSGIICFLVLLLLYLFSPEWRTLGWEGWYTLSVTAIAILVLISEALPPAFVFLVALTAVYAAGVVDSSAALEGFSDTGVATVGVMFCIAKAVEESRALNFFIRYVLRQPKSLFIAQIRLLFPVAFVSTFLNNTPIVAMLIPVVDSWSRQCKLSPSKLMMPLSFATVLGGVCSIIGTSSNLIVESLAQKFDPSISFGFFEVGYVGIPVAIIGILYMLVATPCLLRDRFLHGPSSTSSSVSSSRNRKYFTVAVLNSRSGMIGKQSDTISMDGLEIKATSRRSSQNELINMGSTHPSFILSPGDLLLCLGPLRSIMDLYAVDGIVPATLLLPNLQGARADRLLMEVIIDQQNPLVGLSSSSFCQKYNGVVLAIYRPHRPIQELCDTNPALMDDVVIREGDSLFIETTRSFADTFSQTTSFLGVSELPGSPQSITPRRVGVRMVLVVILALVMILTAAIFGISILPLALIVACLYILIGALTWQQALKSVQANTLLLIACSFSLGNALSISGVANVISSTLVNVFSVFGDFGVLFSLYLATTLLSSVINNSATVSLMWTIAANITLTTNLSVESVSFALMLAASNCFSTPIGYQTNLMVMEPGRYRTLDYIIFGGPLSILTMFVSVVLIYAIWG